MCEVISVRASHDVPGAGDIPAELVRGCKRLLPAAAGHQPARRSQRAQAFLRHAARAAPHLQVRSILSLNLEQQSWTC